MLLVWASISLAKFKKLQTLATKIGVSFSKIQVYAPTLIVVVLIVANFGWFLVIARNPPDGF